MTANEYFECRNGGKSAENMTMDNEWITPIYAIQLMEDYHKDSLSDELLAFNSWMCGKQYDGRIPLINTCIKDYLKQKGLPL
jgi:hypothetical protein